MDTKKKENKIEAENGIIRVYPDPVLRKKTRELSLEEIKHQTTKKIIKKMTEALFESPNGVGLAAPQIGISKAIFIVPLKVIEMDKKKKEEPEKDNTKVLVFINPRITKASKKKEVLYEGCLSTPNLYGQIKRSRQVTIEALNENGKKITRGAGGLLAEIFQHETDHLNGKLFIDEATDLRKHEPPE
ncbi:MAG: peptide deformylase [Candidatus Niyogibacteria bacterium CG10_big_fil_rev_8_21_14_0_10_42_19]|uniref:Peptide deformylase n=1 Tax=Candidatus Niyogibacteria bacterium CG10_big_fil_rev_8_21_14_0_10_42_19 TaxID=1974725 RepID=A0A2H0TFX0_9BACT|nr:MAG: peptide deformylase [Candidatus Niyogibacteria bacterium CG10_big_fil_rev_8_21_14_0_10_42_19]